ncbi:MAG: isoprenyl transferase [Rhodospirillales bacterium]|nr:isoprenyl transferase [Rhodospirillales bacterium]MCW8969643.1 isoprenyl transferase [Rhodospirillales bacterium]
MTTAPLNRKDNQPPMPTHVAIIMDGNGRWAQARGMPRVAGHRKGAESVREAVSTAVDLGIPYLTLFGFSSENWKRPEDEVRDLMGLLRYYLRSEVAELHRNGIRLRIIGDRQRLATDIVKLIEESESLTAGNSALTLSIALSYGGRADVVNAARMVAIEVAEGRLSPDRIDENLFSDHLSTKGIPDPDLVIRTSGEKRISNFLLWQCAYSEFVFLDTLWPDFTRESFENTIREFLRRDRRFGATGG